jgi:hypothetical protein
MRTRFVLFMALVFFHSVVGMVMTMIFPGAERILRVCMAGGDGLMFLLALSCLFPNRSFYAVQAFVVFFVLSTLTFLYTSERFGLLEHLNGMRESIYLFSTLIVVHDLYASRLRPVFAKLMTRFLIVFAAAQLPVVIYQFLKYGAGDFVGGTFGLAGGSGLVTLLLFLICFYLIVRYGSLEDGSNFKITRVLFFLPVLIPCTLNETKISFVLLAGMFVLLLLSRHQFYRAIPFMAIGGALIITMNYYYYVTVEDTGDLLDENYIEGYLFNGPTETGGDLPRFQRIPLMLKLMKGDVGSYALGLGYGVMGGGNVMGVSRLGRSLYYLVTGSRILLFRVWIQGGFLAVVLFVWLLFGTYPNRPRDCHTHRQFYRFILLVTVIIWVYNEAVLERMYSPVMAFMLEWVMAGGVAGEALADDEAVEESDGTEEAELVEE